MRHLFVYILIIIGVTITSVAFAQNDIQQPVSTNAPAFSSNVDNGLSPQQSYEEYGTIGKPMRQPTPYSSLALPCTGNVCHYPTNKWFIDLTFTSSSGDDFAVAQSPYNIRIFDGVFLNPDLKQIPGVYLAINKPYVVVQPEGPSQNQFFRDTYVKTLQLSAIYHLGLTVPITPGTDNPPETYTRNILDYGQLHLKTEWTGPNNKRLTTWLVRGSPYVTAQYTNMPVTIFENNHSGFVAMAVNDAAEPKDQDPFRFDQLNPDNAKTPTGQIFRLIFLMIDDSVYSTNPNIPEGGPPLLYVEYMIFSSKPLSFTYQPNRGVSYQLLYSQNLENDNAIVRVAYVGSGYALNDQGNQTSDINLASKYALNVLINNTHLATEQMLTQYANIYPIGADIELSTSGGNGNITFNWKTDAFTLPSVGNNQLLMLGFKATHGSANQLKTEVNPQPSNIDSNYAPITVRGPMYPIVGKTWTLQAAFPNEFADSNLWFGTPGITNENNRNHLRNMLKTDASLLIDPKIPGTYGNTLIPIVLNDSYAFGKEIARLARLVVLSEQLGDTDSKNKFLTPLKQYLSRWFDGATPNDPVGKAQNYFVYDNRFGGVITARASFRPDGNPECSDGQGGSVCGYNQDFYNGQFTDHHFHYGYYIFSAAVIAKYDTDGQWLNKYKDKIDLLVRDIANPSDTDTYFPTYRHFDWFEGHAYANGLGPGSSGRNQESTSEGLNAWYAITLWGDATGREYLKDIGRIMASQEILAAQKWTQINPNPDKSIYDGYVAKATTRNNEHPIDIAMNEGLVTGINWSNKIDHGTFFGTRLSYMVGIQLMPYIPFSAALLSQEWLQSVKDPLTSVIQGRIDLMNLYADFPNVLGLFAKEWPNFCAAKNNGTISIDKLVTQFWGSLQGTAKDAYQWSLINMLALAPVDADSAYNFFAPNTQGKAYSAIFNGENGFENEAQTTPIGNAVVKYSQNCNKNGDIYPDACFLGSPLSGEDNCNAAGSWQEAVVPYLAVDYNIIDRGMSLTNALWWILIHKQTDLPNTLYWPGTLTIDQTLGTSAKVSWQAAASTNPNSNVTYDAELSGFNQGRAILNCSSGLSCTFSNLSSTTPYLVTVTALDKASPNAGQVIKTVRIYTQPDSIKYAIVWDGEIQPTLSADKKSVTLNWQAHLDPKPTPPDNTTISFVTNVYNADNNRIGGCDASGSMSCGVNLAVGGSYYATVTASAQGKALEVTKQVSFSTTSEIVWDNPNVRANPNADAGSAVISWDAASITPTAPIHYVANITGPQTTSCATDDVTSCTVDQLTTAGTYTVTVTASANNSSKTSDAVSFTITPKGPTLNWPTGASITASLLNNQKASISWTSANLQNGGGLSVTYQVTLAGSNVCTTTGVTNCMIDIGTLKPGDYDVNVSASAGNLNAPDGPKTTLNIPQQDNPSFTVCKRTTLPRLTVTFSADVSDIQGWHINDVLVPTSNIQGSGTKYYLSLSGINVSIKAATLTVTYSDMSTATQPIITSATCQ